MLEPEPLPEGVSLRVWSLSAPLGTPPVFESGGKWLHPLFELTEFLGAHPEIDREDLILRDRIIGRAAAFLMIGLGIKHVGGQLVSQRALSLFASRGWKPFAEAIVDKISCQTEDLLAEVNDFDEAWKLLSERRRRALENQRLGS